MPSIEIISVQQKSPSDFGEMPFAVSVEKELVSHRSPSLFQNDFNQMRGYIYHLGKPKTFMLIAGDLAAEQRTVVAHSASYGSDRTRISQAPGGATENHDSTPYFFLSHTTPWLTQIHPLRSFDLWPTPSPIC